MVVETCKDTLRGEGIVHCTLEAGHSGYHKDVRGLPFGPWRSGVEVDGYGFRI